MVLRCLICRKRHKDGATLHRFPSCKEQSDKWMFYLKGIREVHPDWTPRGATRICSDHFDERCFEQNREDKLKRLRYMSVPSINPSFLVAVKSEAKKYATNKSSSRNKRCSFIKQEEEDIAELHNTNICSLESRALNAEVNHGNMNSYNDINFIKCEVIDDAQIKEEKDEDNLCDLQIKKEEKSNNLQIKEENEDNSEFGYLYENSNQNNDNEYLSNNMIFENNKEVKEEPIDIVEKSLSCNNQEVVNMPSTSHVVVASDIFESSDRSQAGNTNSQRKRRNSKVKSCTEKHPTDMSSNWNMSECFFIKQEIEDSANICSVESRTLNAEVNHDDPNSRNDINFIKLKVVDGVEIKEEKEDNSNDLQIKEDDEDSTKFGYLDGDTIQNNDNEYLLSDMPSESNKKAIDFQEECLDSNNQKVVNMPSKSGVVVRSDIFESPDRGQTSDINTQRKRRNSKDEDEFNGISASYNQYEQESERGSSDCIELITENGNKKKDVAASNKKTYKSQIYECNLCSYEIYDVTSYINHMNNHTGDHKYRCSLCDYQTSDSSNYETHLTIHTSSAHRCSLCDYETLDKNDYINHIKNHTDAHIYRCNLCEYQASHKTSYTHHMDKHTGDHNYCTKDMMHFKAYNTK